jgi:hypothetical protein
MFQLGTVKIAPGSFGIGQKPFSKTEIAEGQKFAAACQMTSDDERACAGFGAAIQGFFGLATQTPGLNKILFRVFDSPSIWSLVRKGRMPSGGISWDLVATPLDLQAWCLPSVRPLYALPLTVVVNDRPGLYLSALVIAPHPPFLLTGGVVALLAVNTTDREKWLLVVVMSARRGGSTTNLLERPVLAANRPAPGLSVSTNFSFQRVALIGASVTHGFTASEPFGGTNTARYDLSRYLDAALQVPHGPISNLGNALFFMNPDSSAEQQIARALECEPTLMVGIDFLFWFCYGKGYDEPGRLQHFDKGLELLDTIPCPLIIGDIPDASAAVNGMLSADEIPSAPLLAAANRRLKEWAAKRPGAVVVPLTKFMASVLADRALAIHGLVVPAGQTRALIQDDKLHPSERGCAMLALEILDSLQSRHPEAAGHSAVCWDVQKLLRQALAASPKDR